MIFVFTNKLKKKIMNFKDFTKAIHKTNHLTLDEKQSLYDTWRKEYLKKLKKKYSFNKSTKS